MEEKFVKIEGKIRQDKKTYSKEQITAPTYAGDYGRLINCGYVIFDFDEQPYIDIISNIIKNLNLKCKILTTTRGLHLMFRTTLNQIKNKSSEFNWLGLKCDIKGLGIHEVDKIAYQAIKVNGETRKEEFINGATSNEELDFAPMWLYHVPKKKEQIDLTEDLTGTRNDMFHSTLMIRAKRNGFTYNEYVEQAHLINKYVLPNGLNENELNTAIRQEEWDNLQIGNENQLLFLMAQDVIDYWNCLWTNEQIVFFNHNENRYDRKEIILKGYLQEKYKYENITISKMKEVLEQVSIQLQNKPEYWKERSSEYILCKDKLVSVSKDEVIPNTRTIYTDIYYPYEIMTKEEFENFNGRAKSFMEEISCYDKDKNPDILTIIWECIGCMLAPTKPFAKIFIWYGSGANGKSLLLKVVQKIMEDFMTHANILTINDKFALENVVNGVANVTDDVGVTTLKETGTLKSLIQGGAIEVPRKYKSSIWWKPNSQFIICCNEVPKINDTSPGMIRRLAFIPFEMQLKEEDIDIMLETTLKNDIDNLRYIMTGAIFAYRKALEQGHLTEIPKQKDLMNDFLEENKSCIDLFFDSILEEEGNGDLNNLCEYLNGKTTEEIYNKYKEFRLDDKNIEIQKTFTRRFKKKLPTKIELIRHCLGGHSFTSYSLKV